MYKKNIKPFFPGASRNIILVVLVLGVGAIFYGIDRDIAIVILGTIVVLMSVFILTGQYTMEIDFEDRQYRSGLSFIYVLKFGVWKPLPEIKEISLIPSKHFVTRQSLKHNLYTEEFQIRLMGVDPEDTLTVSRGLYGELILEAEELSKELNIALKEF